MGRTFKIPVSLERQMDMEIVSQGFGLKGKSKWISEAIDEFLTLPDEQFILDCIDYGQYFERLDKSISFTPTDEAERLLSEWVVKARMKMPMLEGVKSKIIRTAIIQRLLGSAKTFQKVHSSHFG
jgi:hypothetical protein